MAHIIEELRRAYPTMVFSLFVQIYEEHKGDEDKLLGALDTAEAEALSKKAEFELKLAEVRARLSASEQHHALKFVVHADIDLEHVQAILMYGFIMPGSERSFIGSKTLPEHHVRKNVQNKLGFKFSLNKYNTALAYVKREGIVSIAGREHEEGLSLKSGPDSETSTHGAQILHVAHEYAYKKKLRR